MAVDRPYRAHIASLHGPTHGECYAMAKLWPRMSAVLRRMSEIELMALSRRSSVSRATLYKARRGIWPPSMKTMLLIYAGMDRIYWPRQEPIWTRLDAIRDELATMKAGEWEKAPRYIRTPDPEPEPEEA